MKPMDARRVAFCGHSGSGKDEAATYLCRTYAKLVYGHSMSWYIAEELAPQLGVSVEVLRGPERHRYAEQFFRYAEEVRTADPGHFLRRAFEHGNVVTGVRDLTEVAWGREHGTVDLFIWIDRPVPVDPTMRRFGPDGSIHCDVTLVNRGTLAAYHSTLRRWADFSGFARLDRGTPPM
jgi:hypothetical protein